VAHVVVVGAASTDSPEYPESLRRLADDHAPGRVHFVGYVTNPWQALAAFDVLVVPSLSEPFGRVAAEGQRAGVPVLAADAAGLREIVTDGHDGLLFPPADPAGLAACLTRVLSDDALRLRLAEVGRQTSVRFDPATHAAAMGAIFDRCLWSSRGVARTAEARGF
jgi:glycosyltransferase involved in cell wall biosynthesis